MNVLSHTCVHKFIQTSMYACLCVCLCVRAPMDSHHACNSCMYECVECKLKSVCVSVSAVGRDTRIYSCTCACMYIYVQTICAIGVRNAMHAYMRGFVHAWVCICICICWNMRMGGHVCVWIGVDLYACIRRKRAVMDRSVCELACQHGAVSRLMKFG